MKLSVLLSVCFSLSKCDKFSEELLLTPLASGDLSAYFKFTTLHPGDLRDSPAWADYDLFPRPLGELLGEYRVQEMSLSLTQGLWRYGQWGYPVSGHPPGASLEARFLPAVESVDRQWSGLTNGLAGLLCASLNKLDTSQAISPAFSFQPRGALGANLTQARENARFGILPKENVCTENLTPWKKLLPCKGKRGLAVLLNSGVIQKHSSHQSLLLSVRPVCADPGCSRLVTELSQELTLVFDPAIYNNNPTNTDWSLKQLFGIGVSGSCPMASTSNIFVDVTNSRFSLNPPPDREVSTGGGDSVRTYGVYDVSRWSPDNSIRDLKAGHVKPHIHGVVRGPVLTVSRHLTGIGRERGGVRASIRNNGKEELTIVYLDIIPWYLRLYLHSLTITTNGRPLTPSHVEYRPGVDRERPYHLELVLSLPPRSTTHINFQLELSMLRWVEYPPDANHGFYVGSAVITARIPHNKNITMLAPEDSTLSYAIWGNPPTLNSVLQIYTEVRTAFFLLSRVKYPIFLDPPGVSTYTRLLHAIQCDLPR